MISNELKMDIEVMEREIEILKTKVLDFKPYSEGFIKDSSIEMKNMSSNFTIILKKTMENMKDTKAPKLCKKLEKFCEEVESITKLYAEEDRAISECIRKEK